MFKLRLLIFFSYLYFLSVYYFNWVIFFSFEIFIYRKVYISKIYTACLDFFSYFLKALVFFKDVLAFRIFNFGNIFWSIYIVVFIGFRVNTRFFNVEFHKFFPFFFGLSDNSFFESLGVYPWASNDFVIFLLIFYCVIYICFFFFKPDCCYYFNFFVLFFLLLCCIYIYTGCTNLVTFKTFSIILNLSRKNKKIIWKKYARHFGFNQGWDYRFMNIADNVNDKDLFELLCYHYLKLKRKNINDGNSFWFLRLRILEFLFIRCLFRWRDPLAPLLGLGGFFFDFESNCSVFSRDWFFEFSRFIINPQIWKNLAHSAKFFFYLCDFGKLRAHPEILEKILFYIDKLDFDSQLDFLWFFCVDPRSNYFVYFLLRHILNNRKL